MHSAGFIKAEKGSMTLLGIWLMGFMLFISAMLFVYSNQEIRVSNLERESYYRQLLAESLLEKELLILNRDFSLLEKVMEKKEYVNTKLDEGIVGKYLYEVKCLHGNGKVSMAAVVGNKDDPTYENLFYLRWYLDVNEDEKTVTREGIG